MEQGNPSRDKTESGREEEESSKPMTTTRRKRLIEVAFPLEEVSAHSRREKNVRHGHVSALHQWWARRPLAACRAFIYASLVDDPKTDAEREELLKEVADLASWDAVRHPDRVVRTKADGGSGLTGALLLRRARQRILDCNDGKPPKLLDPFAGGGAIPLEGLRLGCEVEASDLNPVAVLILKGTIEYPQKYGQPDSRPVPDYIVEAGMGAAQARFADGDLTAAYRRNPLATDVRYWGHWMLERARQELAEFYPPDPDGSVPIAYLWSRTIPCPSCDSEMPLIRQYWLARRTKNDAALLPYVDEATRSVDFHVVKGSRITGDPSIASTTQGDSVCLMCHQVTGSDTVRQMASEGRMSTKMTAVILENRGSVGKNYRSDHSLDQSAFDRASQRLKSPHDSLLQGLSMIPDEPIDPDMLGLRVDAFGLRTWGQLFNDRQLLTLTTLCRLVSEAHRRMLDSGLDSEFARAVTTYLALIVDKAADFGSTLCILNNVGGRGVVHTYGRQILSMVWDYAESNPFCVEGAGWLSYLDRTVKVIEEVSFGTPATVRQANAATAVDATFDVIITDPPYYNAIDYAGLSDFFYVWLKRSIGPLHPDILALPLTPKREQAIMGSESANPKQRERYLSLTRAAFVQSALALESGGRLGVVFAHNDPEAWGALMASLLGADLLPDASWPIDTERSGKISAATRANLQTSVWMACRKPEAVATEAFLSDVMEEMRPVIRERLLYFWGKGIRGADFFISAIGPALSVFGQHTRVLRPDGDAVSVRDFLDIVRRESTAVALEQVLHGANLGLVDPITRQYVTWVWSYSRAPLNAGEAIALCLATGAAYDEMTRPNSIAIEVREKNKKMVRLRTIRQRAMDDEDLGNGHAARPTPLIDHLQHAAWLWGQNLSDRLAAYRGQLGETRWLALQTLGQAIAECLPDGDEDRRIVLGLLGSNVMAAAPRVDETATQPPMLPGFESKET